MNKLKLLKIGAALFTSRLTAPAILAAILVLAILLLVNPLLLVGALFLIVAAGAYWIL